MAKGPVTQPWTWELTLMQQSVLLAAVRGPDGIRKDHVSKLLLRWFRRCIVISAFDGKVLGTPSEEGGGSFTGPSCLGNFEWQKEMDLVVTNYLRTVDELPHHFQVHLMHAAEILGYAHPDDEIRLWWNRTYLRLINDLHAYPEPKEIMNMRLGDNETAWRAAEEVTAEGPR